MSQHAVESEIRPGRSDPVPATVAGLAAHDPIG